MPDLKGDTRDWEKERRRIGAQANFLQSATARRRLELGPSGVPHPLGRTREQATRRSEARQTPATPPATKLETAPSDMPYAPYPRHLETTRDERHISESGHQSSRVNSRPSPLDKAKGPPSAGIYATEAPQQFQDYKSLHPIWPPKAVSSMSGLSKLPAREADDISVAARTNGKHLSNPFIQAGKLQDLPMLFGTKTQKQCNAIPDTGATINVVSHHFLEDVFSDYIPIMFASTQEEANSNTFEIANGKTLSTTGQVTIPCAFPDTPGVVMEIVFYVCKSLADHVQVVFGKPFLDATRVLSAFSHRLVERPETFDRFPRVMRMCTGDSADGFKMRILMESTLVLAYPDTGSEIDLISKDFVGQIYASFLELESSDPQRIQFVNGESQRLLGKIIVKISIPKIHKKKDRDASTASALLLEMDGSDADDDEDQLDDRSWPSNILPDRDLPQERAFYIVAQLQCNVILGQAFLNSVDAFKTQKHALSRSDSAQTQKTVNGIFVLSDAQNTWVEFWSKYRKRGEFGYRLPSKSRTSTVLGSALTYHKATDAELHRALNEVDQGWIRNKRQRENCINEAKSRLRDALVATEVSKHASHVTELEKQQALAAAEYDADVLKVREAFEKAKAATEANNMPPTTTAPKQHHNFWSNLLRPGNILTAKLAAFKAMKAAQPQSPA
jgi:hypothetical protein